MTLVRRLHPRRFSPLGSRRLVPAENDALLEGAAIAAFSELSLGGSVVVALRRLHRKPG